MKKVQLTSLSFNCFDSYPEKTKENPQANCFELGKEFEIDKEGHIISGIFQYKDNKFLFCVIYSGEILFCIADPSCLTMTKTIIEIGNSRENDKKLDTTIMNELIISIIRHYKDKNLTGFYW